MRFIYLDYNATTPVAPSVVEAMTPFYTEHYGNPSSSHIFGRACREAMEDARSKLSALLGADRDEVIFSSGGTESNNLAILGVMLPADAGDGGHLIISAIEHPAVSEPAAYLERCGYEVTVVGCDANGVVDPDRVRAAVRPDTRLVSIMHANNETGVIQPIREIADICHAQGVLMHTDAAQSTGKIDAFVDDLGVDLLTLAGHKLYAPKGIGVLYIRRGVRLEPVLHGAGHERGLRPGTENVAFMVGLGQAGMLALHSLEESARRISQLRDRLQTRLLQVMDERLRINGMDVPRLPNTLSASFLGVSGADVLARAREVCASTGSACHASAVNMSPTLAAMGLTPEQAQGTIRLSLGWFTSEADVERAADLLLEAWETLR